MCTHCFYSANYKHLELEDILRGALPEGFELVDHDIGDELKQLSTASDREIHAVLLFVPQGATEDEPFKKRVKDLIEVVKARRTLPL